MSLRSKWRQFVNWVSENKVKPEDPMYDVYNMQRDQEPENNNPWTAGEGQAVKDEFKAGSKYATGLIDWYAGYLDSKMGAGPPPTQGIVTGNPNVDGIAITGVLLLLILALIRKLFA